MQRQVEPLDVGLFLILLIWQIFWRGIALWKSAQFGQRRWFIAFVLLTVINTAGVVEIIYLVKFAKQKLTLEELKSWFSRLRPRK